MLDNESSPGDARVSAAEMPSLSGLLSLAIAVVVVATLYLARDLFVPFTLALLLSFVLAPFVRILRWARLPHRPAAVIAVLLALAVILAVGGVIGTQIASLAEDLPRYETTIRQKVDTVRAVTIGRITGLLERIDEVRTGGSRARRRSRKNATIAESFRAARAGRRRKRRNGRLRRGHATYVSREISLSGAQPDRHARHCACDCALHPSAAGRSPRPFHPPGWRA